MLSIKVNKNIVKLKRIHIKNFITHNPKVPGSSPGSATTNFIRVASN